MPNTTDFLNTASPVASSTDTIQTITASGPMTAWSSLVLVDSPTPVTITLPAAALISVGKQVKIVNINLGVATVIANGVETLVGGTTVAKDAASSYEVTAAGVVRAFADLTPSAQLSYMVASLTAGASQTTNLTPGDHFKFQRVVSSTGTNISLDTTTAYTNTTGVASLGRFTLKANKTYKLSATSGQTVFAPTAGDLEFTWYDVTANTPVGAALAGSAIANVSTQGSHLYEQIFTPSVDTLVEVRIASQNGDPLTAIGFTNFGYDRFPVAIIQELPTTAGVYPGTVPVVDLKYARYWLTANAASTSFATAPGTRLLPLMPNSEGNIPSDALDLAIPQAGRYRFDWLLLAPNTELDDDGEVHVVVNGVSVKSVFYDMNQTSAVNQTTGTMTVDLQLNDLVGLRYAGSPTADTIAWGKGSYFQVQQIAVKSMIPPGSVGAMVGADGVNPGALGYIGTAPAASDNLKFWRGDGTWAEASVTDTVQIAAVTGSTTITAWSSVVLLPTQTGNITLVYPTPSGNQGKFIKVIRSGIPNGFTVTHTPASGTLSLTNAGSELDAANGSITVEALPGSNLRQVANSLLSPVVTDLTYGRVNATADLASIAFSITAPGTKIPFNGTVYSSGVTFSGTDAIVPSQAGRYRVSWFMLAPSTEFNGDGTFHVVQNGVSLGSVFVDIMQASAVNQISSFLDVDLVAGQAVELRYQPVVADSVPWGKGSYFDVSQLPTAVAPVVSTVVEYGEQKLTTTTVGAATVDIGGGSFTLPSAGVWEVEYYAYVTTSAGNSVGALFITDSSNVEVLNSRASTGTGTTPSGNTGSSISQKVRISITGPATYKIRGQGNSAGVVVQPGVAVAASNKVTWIKVAGYLPSTGSTTDYVQVYRTSTQTVANNSPVLFGNVLTGNIPYDSGTGQFTLSANKTYRLSSNLAIFDNANQMLFNWFDVTANAAISPTAGVAASNYTGATGDMQAEVIFTPTVSTIVQLRNVTGASRTINGASVGTNTGTSHAIIQQIGSTNTLGGDISVNDQSSGGYFDIGNMRYQWGTFIQGSGATGVSLPAPFANTAYVINGNVQDAIANTTVVGTTFSNKTTVGCDSITNSWNGTAVNTSAGRVIGYTAVGQKP